MKKYCFNNFFKVYYIRGIQFKYITQNKDLDKLKNSCFKKLLENYKNEKIDGFYFAITNDVIIKRLERIERMKVKKFALPYKMSIKELKKYLVGKFTSCVRCKEKCIYKDTVMNDSEKMKCYCVFFWKSDK